MNGPRRRKSRGIGWRVKPVKGRSVEDKRGKRTLRFTPAFGDERVTRCGTTDAALGEVIDTGRRSSLIAFAIRMRFTNAIMSISLSNWASNSRRISPVTSYSVWSA